MDLREIYGCSPWHRATFDLLAEEVARIGHAALMSGMVFALPAEVTEASPDGHSVTVRPTVKKAVLDPVTGQRTFEDHPIAPDTPIHFPGGGGTVLTHGLSVADELSLLYFSRNIDGWRQLSGSQQPYDGVQNHLGDSVAIPGIRSDPKKLQQVATDAMHLRSEDKLHVHELHPERGHRTFSADPSTQPASPTFDPLSQAEKYIDHAVTGAGGLVGRAVDGDVEHSHGVDHGGAFMRALGALHQVLCNPEVGALLSAAGGAHTVKATPGGVQIASSAGVSISCPPGMLSLPTGGVSGSSIQGGGDISGTLDKAQVVSILNVSNANLLPNAANDAAAAALNPPVSVGSLYRNGSVLMVRMA